ncbi:MAG: hypothetical protein ACOYME_00335 [Prochlorotrichaceae cyanobacterium]
MKRFAQLPEEVKKYSEKSDLLYGNVEKIGDNSGDDPVTQPQDTHYFS